MDVRQPDGNHDPRDDGNLRSDHGLLGVRARDADCSLRLGERDVQWLGRRGRRIRLLLWPFGLLRRGRARSEEHTSELQSRPHLVCRLLLEKKKHNVSTILLLCLELNVDTRRLASRFRDRLEPPRSAHSPHEEPTGFTALFVPTPDTLAALD